MKRTTIGKLKPAKQVLVEGFIDKVRDQKSIMFIVLRDATGSVQVTVKKENAPQVAEALSGLQLESTVRIWGECVEAPNVKLGGIEIIPTKVEVTSFAQVSPIDKDSSPDLQMDYRWLDLRDEKKRLWFQVQTNVLHAIREWFVDNGFIEIMTPKLSAFTTEGGSEVFEVKYFGKKAYMTQSPQLFKQMAIAGGFEKVFEIGGCYRAEKSFTSRHATEFFALDVEIGHVEDEHCAMDVEEAMLKSVFATVAKTSKDLFEKLGITFEVPTAKFPRFTMVEAYELLEKEKGYTVPRASKGDLDPEGERLLCEIAKEKFNSDFMFVTQFPSASRAFYTMKREDDPKISRGFDLLYKGVEITSGAQREHRPELLRKNIAERGIDPKDMDFYVQFFEYGCPQHGGFALGIGRLMAKILNTPSIKDTTFLFRGPDRLAP